MNRTRLLSLGVGLAVASVLLPATPASAVKRKIKSVAALYDGLAPSVVLISVIGPGVTGIGSGVVLHKDGYIATAAHVVEGSAVITVEFTNGERQVGTVATLSRTEDLALIKVPVIPKGTFIPVLADSDQLSVGQSAFCIGAPLGLKHTLTTGIISAVRKNHGSELSMYPKNVIQTDAAINQGNSGGALFNEKGEVIGIASYIASKSGGSIGLGFAVPSNTVRKRLFERPIPYMGMVLRRVPAPLAELLNWPPQDALLIEKVDAGSPAGAAGLRGGFIPSDFAGVKVLMGGDLIVGVNEWKPSQSEKIHKFLTGLKEGDTVKYTVIRKGQTFEAEVTMGPVMAIPKLKGGPRKKR